MWVPTTALVLSILEENLHVKVGESHACSVLETSHWQGATLECPIPCHYLEKSWFCLPLAFLEAGHEERCSPLKGDMVQILTLAPSRCRAEEGFPMPHHSAGASHNHFPRVLDAAFPG